MKSAPNLYGFDLILRDYLHFEILDMVQQLASGADPDHYYFALHYPDDPESDHAQRELRQMRLIGELLNKGFYDINEVLRLLNIEFDNRIRIVEQQSWSDIVEWDASFERQYAMGDGVLHAVEESQAFRRQMLDPGDRHDLARNAQRLYHATLTVMHIFPLVSTGIQQEILMKEQAALTGLQVMRFRLDHNRLPATLDELVPEYMDELPEDYFSLEPLRYRILDDGFVVYSVGRNIRDVGGFPVDDRDDPKYPGNFGFHVQWQSK